MGTLIPRKRKDGSIGYTALIAFKRDGKIARRKPKTFDRKQAANAWMVPRKIELRKPGGVAVRPTAGPSGRRKTSENPPR
jgi:hypothetical protein